MKRFITVAAIQMEIIPLDIQTNTKKAEQLLKNALAEMPQLDLVVFPEYFITGPLPYNQEYAMTEDSEPIAFFKALAAKHKVYIACGSFLRKDGSSYFNTSYLIDKKGKIILQYDKNNLWHPERRYITPGTELPIVKTSIGTIGIAICWDLAFPEVFQKLACRGADIICLPSYWTTEDSGSLIKKYPGVSIEAHMVDTLCPARATENNLLLIYANGAQRADVFLKTKKLQLKQLGHSQICAPIYGTARKITGNNEGYIIYKYDRHIAKNAEQNYKLRKDKADNF